MYCHIVALPRINHPHSTCSRYRSRYCSHYHHRDVTLWRLSHLRMYVPNRYVKTRSSHPVLVFVSFSFQLTVGRTPCGCPETSANYKCQKDNYREIHISPIYSDASLHPCRNTSSQKVLLRSVNRFVTKRESDRIIRGDIQKIVCIHQLLSRRLRPYIFVFIL